jgi:hypothetical protein
MPYPCIVLSLRMPKLSRSVMASRSQAMHGVSILLAGFLGLITPNELQGFKKV